MQVDYVLILAAGKGTRMGEVGRSIPKVLWPIFEKTLLELEIAYANQFNPKEIFINLFHRKDFIEKEILSKKMENEITIVKENSVLDIGGAIHNIASKVDYKGKLLVINSDQFIILDDRVKEEFSSKMETSDVCLLSYTVPTKDGYNALSTIDNKLNGIVPNEKIEEATCETYTGMSCINLESLKPVQGESKFFESVAVPAKMNIRTLNIKSSRYWDFGTLRRYYDSMFSILNSLNKGENDVFISFLKKSGAIDEKKIGLGGYDAPSGVIDLGKNTTHQENTIYLAPTKINASIRASIISGDSEDLVPSFD